MNKMKDIRIEKVTLNVGAGKDQKILEKAVKLMTNLTGIPPVKTITNKRLQAWGLRPGLPIGCKLTLRGEAAEKLVPRLLHAKDGIIGDKCFDDYGNISFGLPEYMDIKDAKYDPEIGMMGLQTSITLTRPGYRVKSRKIRPSKVSVTHRVKKEEAIQYMKEKYSLKIGEKE
jgi:large subunit ribosomal protein L5